MNKNLIIGGVILLVILGIGGYMFMNKSQSPLGQGGQEGVFTTIRDALSKSMSLECDYTTPEGAKVKAYIKNGQVRSDMVSNNPEESGSSIIKDNKVYFWNSQMAMMMEMPDISITPEAGQDEVENKGESTIESLEQYKQYCHPAVVSDSVFTPPSDIQFQDYSELMKGMMEQGAKSVPTGSQGSAPEYNQQQIEDLMKQYQQQ